MLSRIRRALKDMGELVSVIKTLTRVMLALNKNQEETNSQLRSLVQNNQSFLSALTAFLAREDRRKADKERIELEEALSRTPTEHDKFY